MAHTEVTARYDYRMTPYMESLLLGRAADDPLSLQFLPDARELPTLPHEISDPIGDAAFSPVKGIVHRYPDRVLLKVAHSCPVYCRFCFRREMIGSKGEPFTVIRRLTDRGIVLLSQTVLLKGVNDCAPVLDALFRKLVRLRVRPYYLHHPDLAPGTSHFRVSIEVGQELMRTLRGTLSGLCMPTYVLDIPGGFGKVPIGPSYVGEKSASGFRV